MSHNNPPEPDLTSPPLLVSTLGIHLDPQSGKKGIDTVVVKAGDVTEKIFPGILPGGRYQQRFDPPLEVLFHSKISISAHIRGTRRVVSITLDPKDVMYEANEVDGAQVYNKTERNVEFTIGIQSLPSTISEIVATCSRFRVLIIGESGVGKSSLIKKVFGVAGVHVSDTTRGEAEIDQEYVAGDNDHFVVHDSRGFEAGDQRNLVAAREFISRRKSKRDLRNQLHAVWLCLAIPFAGGRLLETGVEEFIRDRREILGNVPLVVVFTKLDLLVNKLNAEALEGGELPQEDALKERTLEHLETFCLKPVRAAAGSESIPHAAVSTAEDHEGSLVTLVNKTTENIQKYIKDEAAHHIAAIAQRVSISVKVQLTINIGEKRYWKALAASPNFRGHTLKECLNVLHKDIVTVWNFKDPEHSLHKDDFKEGLLNTSHLRVREIQDFRQTAQSSISMIAALVTIIVGVGAGTAGAALPIVVPVAGAVLLGKLAHDLYKSAQNVVRQLMAYIVDLTCVMQILFLLTSVHNGSELTVELVGRAMEAYERSHRSYVHAEINAFEIHLVVAPGRRDRVLEKIKELIQTYTVPDDTLAALRRELHS